MRCCQGEVSLCLYVICIYIMRCIAILYETFHAIPSLELSAVNFKSQFGKISTLVVMAKYRLLLSICLLLISPALSIKIQQFYEFPNNTCLENLVVRPDGSILTTLTTAPEIYLVQPSVQNPRPALVHTFTDTTSVLGISEETVADSYQVATVNLTSDNQDSVRGTAAIWRVRFCQGKKNPTVTLTAKLPNVALPNGLNDHIVLVADSTIGNIVSVDTRIGLSKVIISDPLLQNTLDSTNGVNGLKIRCTTLYFTNSGQKILGKMRIDCSTGAALGPATVVTQQYPGPPILTYDDFTLGPAGKFAFLATAGGNTIQRVNLATGEKTTIAGNMNSTQFAQPTSAQFARGKPRTLYVATAGGYGIPVNGDEIIGGQLIAITLD